MTFLRRLFGVKPADGYDRAIALVEDDRPAEALPLLREVFEHHQASPRGSLAGYYLRQSLVSEGKRLLATGSASGARRHLDEAVRHWPEFPDLRFLAGASALAEGDEAGALEHARHALRRNPDYCEARLLEAAAMAADGRLAEAAESLNKLVESGRRVDHTLARRLARDGAYEQGSLPADLAGEVRQAAVGDDAKNQLAQAVAACRAGRWDDGLAVFAQLAGQFPRYADIRAKYGAALYQVGRLDEAMVEVEAALGINPRYRTAVSLRGLMLAERGELARARDELAAAVPRLEGTAGRHEELFLCYLQGTLALLLGDRPACRSILAGWNELGRQFGRAELLLVACDDLDGLADAAQMRLNHLVDQWPSDAEFLFLRAAMQLQQRQYAAVEDAIARWPGRAAADDQRPVLLQAYLDQLRGRVPQLPPRAASAGITESAWQVLSIHANLLDDDPEAAAAAVAALESQGGMDEVLGMLAVQTTRALPAGCIPDRWLPDLCARLRQQGDDGQANQLVEVRRSRHPHVVAWSWLSADFWLGPVRRWLA